MYFLVTGSVRFTPYMGDSKIITDIRLVKADSHSDAKDKYNKWWENKSDDYSDSYIVNDCNVTETIE